MRFQIQATAAASGSGLGRYAWFGLVVEGEGSEVVILIGRDLLGDRADPAQGRSLRLAGLMAEVIRAAHKARNERLSGGSRTSVVVP